MKAVCLIISLVLVLVLYVFYNDISDYVYYFWDKMKDFVFMLTITILLIREGENAFWKGAFKITSAFFGCRIGVEFLVLAFPVLDTPVLFDLLFYGSWISVLCIIFYEAIVKLYYKILIMFARYKMKRMQSDH